MAQMPPGPGFHLPVPQQSVDDLNTDMTAKQGELNTAQARLGQLDDQLAAARAKEDVTNHNRSPSSAQAPGAARRRVQAVERG